MIGVGIAYDCAKGCILSASWDASKGEGLGTASSDIIVGDTSRVFSRTFNVSDGVVVLFLCFPVVVSAAPLELLRLRTG